MAKYKLDPAKTMNLGGFLIDGIRVPKEKLTEKQLERLYKEGHKYVIEEAEPKKPALPNPS